MWKKAAIITIPKPGKDPTKPSSYRPIALLTYLSNNTFSIKTKSHLSNPQPIEAKVPQGFCLAMFQYILYANSIPVIDKSTTSLFSDDTMYLTSNEDANITVFQLQRQLNLANDWLKLWILWVNTAKAVDIFFSDLIFKKYYQTNMLKSL